MGKIELKREFFLNTNDGNKLTIEERIDNAVKLLKTEDDYIELSTVINCRNKEDLRKALGLTE